MFQHGRSDSYRVATISATRDDNKTADGREKVHSFTHWRALGAINFPFFSLSLSIPMSVFLKICAIYHCIECRTLAYGHGKMGVMKLSTIALYQTFS